MVKHSKSSKGNSSQKSRSRQRSSSRGLCKHCGRSRSSGRSKSNGKDRRPHSASSSRSGSEKPKQRLNPFNIFVRENMANRMFEKGQAVQEMKKLAEKWKTMSDDEKKKYNEKADKVNDRRAAKDGSEKPKRLLTAYNIYVYLNMANCMFKKGGAIEKMKKLAETWKSMSDDEKKRYQDMADKANERRAAQGTK